MGGHFVSSLKESLVPKEYTHTHLNININLNKNKT